LALVLACLVRSAEAAGVGKRFQQGSHVITKLPIRNPNVAEDMPGQDVKIEMGRDLEVAGPGKDGLDEARIIENRIAGFDIGEKVDERNLIGLGPGKSANNKVEIGRRKAFPTIRPDHRKLIMSISNAAWQAC